MLEGIVTVRAFGAEQRFLNDIHVKIDLTVRMFYNFWMLNRHLLLHFDALGGMGVLAATLFSLSGYVSAGTAGVCITSAMSFCTSVYWACRHWTGLELDLNSVERLVEYLDLPQEPPSIIESSRPPAYWPSSSNEDNCLSWRTFASVTPQNSPPCSITYRSTSRRRSELDSSDVQEVESPRWP
jgi:ABC-type multidrug transport system fused ATPase/permease subunit